MDKPRSLADLINQLPDGETSDRGRYACLALGAMAALAFFMPFLVAQGERSVSISGFQFATNATVYGLTMPAAPGVTVGFVLALAMGASGFIKQAWGRILGGTLGIIGALAVGTFTQYVAIIVAQAGTTAFSVQQGAGFFLAIALLFVGGLVSIGIGYMGEGAYAEAAGRGGHSLDHRSSQRRNMSADKASEAASPGWGESPEASVTQTYCSHCGARLRQDARFCGSCGASV